jgi:hypothetical protein
MDPFSPLGMQRKLFGAGRFGSPNENCWDSAGGHSSHWYSPGPAVLSLYFWLNGNSPHGLRPPAEQPDASRFFWFSPLLPLEPMYTILFGLGIDGLGIGAYRKYEFWLRGVELANTDHAIDVVTSIVASTFSTNTGYRLGTEIRPSALLKHSVCSSGCHDSRHIVSLL